MSGKVYLVGAGPGDPDLLTVKAARLLRRADQVYYDEGVSAALLAQLPPHVPKIPLRQRLLGSEDAPWVAAARSGLAVVLLFGGDPLLFTCAAEVIETLGEAAVPYEIVPGVTGASAAAAIASIPLTDPRWVGRVLLASSNDSHAAWAGNWRSVATGESTLVAHTAAEDQDELGAELLAAGIDEDTPAAVVGCASPAERYVQTATVGTLPTLVLPPGPTILIVGAVAAYAEPRPTAARLSLGCRWPVGSCK